MIYATDLTGVDEGIARRVLAVARSIAPCIDSLEPGDRLDDVLAILRAVATEVPAPGSGRVASQRIGTASVNYRTDASWFSSEDRTALRNICGASSEDRGPMGHFPKSNLLRRLWPEQDA